MKNKNGSDLISSSDFKTIDLIDSKTSDSIDSLLNTKGYTEYKTALRKGSKGYSFVINRKYKVWKSFDSMEILFDYVNNLEPLNIDSDITSSITSNSSNLDNSSNSCDAYTPSIPNPPILSNSSNSYNSKLVIVFCFNSSAKQSQMFKEIKAKYDLINELSLVKRGSNAASTYSFIEVKIASNQKQLLGLIANNSYRKEIEVIFSNKEKYNSSIIYFTKLLGELNSKTSQSNPSGNKTDQLSSIEVNVNPAIKVSYYIPNVYKEVNGFKFNLSYYKEFIGFIIQGNFFPIIKGEEPSSNLGITNSSNNSIKFKKALYTLNPSREQVNYFIKSVLGLKFKCNALTFNKFIKEHSVVINHLHYVKMTDLYSLFKNNYIL